MKHVSLLLFALALVAQSRGTFLFERTTTGSSEAVTLHLPSTSNRSARLVAITVYCATACTAEAARDGSAPTTTASIAVKLNGETEAAATVPYYSSNVGGGQHLKFYNVGAGEEKVIDFPEKGLRPGGNITITPSLSGARVYFQWRE